MTFVSVGLLLILGVVMGMARINNRPVMVYSLDFTVMSGSIGDQGVWKIAELVQMAGQEQTPLIGLIDSAGSRLTFKDGSAGLNGLGRLVSGRGAEGLEVGAAVLERLDEGGVAADL